jgi:hypothetical protein
MAAKNDMLNVYHSEPAILEVLVKELGVPLPQLYLDTQVEFRR